MPVLRSNHYTLLSCFAIGFTIVLLSYVAATTNVWDDETNGYFLSRQPMDKLLPLMASNIHEDPPLYDILLHYWIKLVQYEALGLRSLSVFFWVICLIGIHQTARLLSGPKAACYAIIVAALMPIHWMFPASLRWYSLFACLAVWNTYFFTRILLIPSLQSIRSQWPVLAAYSLTGAALWYCNYAAPAIFAAQAAALLVYAGFDLRKLTTFTIGCGAIFLLYLPWLSVFLRQLGHSSQPFQPKMVAASLYALWAGEVSTPFAWWISVPLALTALVGAALILLHWKSSRIPASMTIVLLLAMIGMNVIWTKRLLIVSPFLALALALAWAASASINSNSFSSSLRRVFLLAALTSLLGSTWNFITKDGWLAYRWLTPIKQTLAEYTGRHPEAALLTNSNSASFFAKDPVGLSMANANPELYSGVKILPFFSGQPATSTAHATERLKQHQSALYIYETSGIPFSSVEPWLDETMRSHGFTTREVHPVALASLDYLHQHPGYQPGTIISDKDRARLVVVLFTRS